MSSAAEILDILADYDSIFESLAVYDQRFQDRFNVFLWQGNAVDSNALRKGYQELIQREAQNWQLQQVLQRKTQRLQYLNRALRELVPALPSWLTPTTTKKANDGEVPTFSDTVAIFSEALAQAQGLRLHLGVVSALQPFALTTIATTEVQALLTKYSQLPEAFAEHSYLSVEISARAESGLPDISKLASNEEQTWALARAVSSHSEVQALLLQALAATPLPQGDPVWASIISDTLTTIYDDIYQFLYSQLFGNGVTTAELANNAQQRFPELPEWFATRLQTESLQVLQEVDNLAGNDAENHNAELQVAREAGLARICTQLRALPVAQIVDFTAPRIYRGRIRPANSYEQTQFYAYAVLDCYYPAGYVPEETLMTSLGLVLEPNALEQFSLQICGEQQNRDLLTQLENNVSLNAVESFALNRARSRPQAGSEYDESLAQLQTLTRLYNR